jgi:hypothetical protein
MTTAETIRARIAEAEACIAAVTDNNFARQVLTARRAALADALALLEQPAPVVTLAPVYFADNATATAPAEFGPGHDGGPAPQIPPAAASPAVRDRVAPSDPPADRGTPSGPEARPRTYTPDRDALLRQLWPDTSLSRSDLRARLNALPGMPIQSNDAMGQRAIALGLRRRSTAAGEAPTAGQRRPGKSTRTPEREALLRALWPDRSVSMREIVRRYNALPGRPIAGDGSLNAIVKAMGLPGRSAEIRRAREQTPFARDAAPDDPLAGLIPDDLAEARRMIASNQHGARDLARHFGWDEPRAIRIAAAIRDDLTRPEIAARLRAEAKAA